jgi:hypothetical protein
MTVSPARSSADRPDSLGSADLDALANLVREAPRNASWWVEVAMRLDDLDDRLALHRAEVEGPQGLHAQILEDSPRVATSVARLEIAHDGLADTIRLLRIQVGLVSGDPDQTDAVASAVLDLVDRLRKHSSAAADVLHEAYRVDVGGE